jgi:hypothetical protein
MRIARIRAYCVLEKILEYIKIGKQEGALPHWR